MDVKMLIFLAIVVAVLPSALSIQCYVCNGKDCITKFNCTSPLDTCMYLYSEAQKTYARSCIDKKTCETSADACKKTAGVCVVKCCQTDLCNKDAPTPAATTLKPSTAKTQKPSTANTQQPLFIVFGVLLFFASFFYLM